MPLWQSLVVVGVSAVVVPTIGWVFVQVLLIRERLVAMETKIAAIVEGCNRHGQAETQLRDTLTDDIKTLTNAVQMTQRNIVAIATKLDVPNLERPK